MTTTMPRIDGTAELEKVVADAGRTKPDARDLAELWKNMAAARVANLERVLPLSDADGRKAIERAIAFAAGPQPESIEGDVDEWAGVVYANWSVMRHTPILRVIARLAGIEKAIAIWIRTSSFGPKGTNGDERLAIVRVSPGASIVNGILEPEVSAASPPIYAACRESAAELFDRSSFNVKLAIAQTFPRDKEWANAVARDFLAGSHPAWSVATLLYRTLDDLALVTEVAKKAGAGAGEPKLLLARFGLDAVPLFFEIGASAKGSHEQDRIARVLTHVVSPEVARFFASQLGRAKVRKHAVAYFDRFPELREELRPIAAGKNRTAQLAKELLDGMDRAASVASDLETAEPEELPEVLRSPPWRAGRKKKRKSIVIEDAPALEGPLTLRGMPDPKYSPGSATPMTDEQVAEWRARVASATPGMTWAERPGLFTDRKSGNALVPSKERLDAWNAGWPLREGPQVALNILREHGAAALPGLIAWAHRAIPAASGRWAIGVVLDLEAPALAPAMALGLRRRSIAQYCREWMRRHADAAIAGLLTAAVGKASSVRSASEIGLRWLAAEGHEARIRERANELGEKGPAAIDEILGWDPLLDCPDKPPKKPKDWKVESLPRPLLQNGKALSLEALEVLCEMLQFSPPEDTYAGLLQVREACEPRSLAELSWSLASGWEKFRARKSEQWMCYSLVHLADDEVVRRTTPALKKPLIVDVLAHIGTEAAQMELATILSRALDSKSVYTPMLTAADAALSRIAEDLGVARDDLDDQITPTLGLDERGSLELDFGSKKLQVGFDEHLVPEIVDEKGARRKQFPRGGKKDDPEKVARARLAWDELREDVESIAILRIEGLELAMLSGRTWTRDAFVKYWARHPLMLHLARRVVWVAQQEGGSRPTFRVAEDGSFADSGDAPLELGEKDKVSVAYELDFPPGALTPWATVFSDYELVQPFPQLGRTRPALGPDELSAETVARVRPNVGHHRIVWRYPRMGWRQERSIWQKPLSDGTIAHASLKSRRINNAYVTVTEIERFRDAQKLKWSELGATALAVLLDQLGLADSPPPPAA